MAKRTQKKETALESIPSGGSKISHLVLKVGGSIVTDKTSSTPKLNSDLMAKYVRLIERDWSKLQGRLILVSGGGSFGHPVVRSSNLTSSLTTSMYDLKKAWANAFSKSQVKVLPMQVMRDQDYTYVLKICERGILPILTCDYVFDGNTERLISSDLVPYFLASKSTRILVMTNVHGVLQHTTRETIENIDADRISAVIAEHVVTDNILDVTGGMSGKLLALRKAVNKGSIAHIMEGSSPPQNISQFLLDSTNWDVSAPYTTIVPSTGTQQ